MARQQLGTPPTRPLDAATKQYVDDRTPTLEAGSGIDQTAIGAFLAAGGNTLNAKRLRGTFTLTGPIVLSTSNTLIDASEARFELAAGSFSRMLQTTTTSLASTTGSISSGSSSLTTAVTLSSAYIGQTITIAGAGGAAPRIGNDPGGSLPGAAAVHAQIVAISGTTVTLSRTARATVSGAVVTVLPRLQNLHIQGGQWERLSGNSSSGFSFTLERVDGFSVQGVEVITHDSKFAMYFGDFSDGVIDGVTLDSNSDGISLSGPGERLVVQNVHGHAEDDGVSLLAASEYAGATLGSSPWGDLKDITINNINIDGVSAVAIVSSALATCDRILVDGVMHEGIDGTVKLGNWVDGSNLDIGSVTVRNVSGLPGVNGSGVVLSRGPSQNPTIKSLVVENVEYLGASTAYPTVAIEGVVQSLSITDARGPRILQVISSTSTVRGSISNARASGTIAIAAFGKMELSLSNVTSAGDIIQFYGSGANNSRFDFDGLCATGGGGTAVMDNSSGVTYYVTGSFGPDVSTTINANAASDAYVYATSATGAWGTDGAGAFHTRNIGFRIDANKVAAEWGAVCYNTNSSAATGGDGPALSNGSGWTAIAAMVNPTTDPLDVSLASPSAPATDKVRLFGRKVAGRMLPAFRGPNGGISSLQATMARNRVGLFAPAGGTGTSNVGFGIATAGTATAANFATTNIQTYLRRMEYLVTTAATTAVANIRGSALFFAGGSSTLGGYFTVTRWGPATGLSNSTRRAFAGNIGSTSAATDVNPSSLVNMAGMGWDATDTNIQFMHNDSSGTATKIDLGASFPRPTADRTSAYEIAMYVEPGSTNISYEVTDLGSGAVATGTVTTNTPATSQGLTPTIYTSVGGTSAVTGLAVASMYFETDN